MSAKVVFSIAVALVMALAACGGGSPDAAKIYADAGEKMAALTSYHVTGEALEEGETGRFEIDIVPPDRFQFTQTSSMEGGESSESTLIGLGDELFFRSSQYSDFFIASEEDFGGATNTSQFLTALTTQITDLTYLGEETIDGVSTHHLQGSLPPKVLEMVEPEEQHAESTPVELWIGKEDSLVRRYHWVDGEETSTLTLSRFDEDISIVAPANPRPAEELHAAEFSSELENFPPEIRDCLRRVWGDDVFTAVEAGTRVLSEEDLEKAGMCSGPQSTEDVKGAFESISDEQRECLRSKLGDDVFAALEAGTRLPTPEEMEKGNQCFSQ